MGIRKLYLKIHFSKYYIRKLPRSIIITPPSLSLKYYVLCLCQVGPPGPGPCHSDPCLNGATCLDTGGGYACLCPPDITGNNCEIRKLNKT